MNIRFRYFIVASVAVASVFGAASAERNPRAISAMLERIGGVGASDKIVTELDESLAVGGKETFTIASEGGKPLVKGSSLSALTTGINWYLNHTARENLSWNRLTTDFGTLPAPAVTETHTSEAEYRYYLNYCTFSYSMSTWTWNRWEKELDYMALHGINMPLQIIGLDVVWRNLLMKDYGYSKDEANAFIAGPCFQAWWGMNNLEGWGGANPDWWYERQEQLARKILARMRELGIEPVLPGFCGMVPSNFTAKTGLSAITQGKWCGFTRPYILNPETAAFKEVAAKYYVRLKELMGESQYYSMDPFHEGANTSGIASIDNAYKAIYDAMEAARPGSKWVIQQWQWSGQQYKVLDNVPTGRLIVLDLYSDGKPNLSAYRGHDVIYNALPNFGGRTGLFGRFNGEINGYFANRGKITGLKGVGATPEAIEQAPVLYDILFELPWHASKPDAARWMADWTVARYGVSNPDAVAAWEIIRNSALNCTTSLQGPHEAVMCARPAWVVKSVSTWGGATIFYSPTDQIASAAYLLLDAGLSGENYSFDLTDVTRQALTDYSYSLLSAINEARTAGGADFTARKATFLELMSDLDRLLGTNSMFRLGRWTEMARGIADEVSGTTEADRRWLELNNARTLITTWGDRTQSESGGLRDYSYRQWNGMLADYYRPRWEKFFAGQSVNWFDNDRAFALNSSKSYSSTPVGDTHTIASELLSKYIARFGSGFICRSMVNDFTDSDPVVAIRGLEFSLPMAGFSITVDGKALPAVIPANYPTGNFEAVAADANGTIVRFRIVVRDEVVNPRTVIVNVDDPAHGSVAIEGISSLSVTSKDPVTVSAVPAAGYRFSHWSIDGEKVSADNPYIYYGASSVALIANFTEANVIDADGTKLYYETNADGSLTVTGVVSFNEDGSCNVWRDEYNVSAITADAFAGNEALRYITLPGSCVSLKGLLHCGTYPGDGVQNRQIKLAEQIPAGASWGMRIRVANNGATFNQWGSGLLATGSDALGATYNGGVQFYLNKAGNIIVKTGSTEHKNLSTVVSSEFTLLALYDAAARRLTVRLVYPVEMMGVAYEKEEYFSIENCQLNAISNFATAIPKGVDIQSLQIFPYRYVSDAFAGCRNLRSIGIDMNWNRIFHGDDFTGILYNYDHLNDIVAFPEGFLFENSFRLASDGNFLCADPVADASGEMIDRDRSVGVTRNLGASSLWRLASVGPNVKVELLNAGRFFGGKPAADNRIELPVSAATYGEYDYDLSVSGSDLKMALRLADSDLYVGADGKLSSTRVDFKVLTDNKIVLPDKVNLVSFPVPVCATDSTYFVTGLDGDMLYTVKVMCGASIPANTGLLILGPDTISADYGLTKPTHALPQENNYLSGSNLSRTGLTPGSFFTYDSASRCFIRSTIDSLPANAAYLTTSAFGNPIAADRLKIDLFDDGSALEEMAVSSDRKVDYYDIIGRPASHGLLIGSDGSKIIRN